MRVARFDEDDFRFWMFDQLGKLYAWGGKGPNSWDCSGLPTMNFRRLNFSSVPHGSYNLYDKSWEVDPLDLRVGDLGFLRFKCAKTQRSGINHVVTVVCADVFGVHSAVIIEARKSWGKVGINTALAFQNLSYPTRNPQGFVYFDSWRRLEMVG